MSNPLSQSPAARAFGRVASAMVTPMTADGDVDYDAAVRLAGWLADRGHDGLIVNGTTGESATTTDEEKIELLRAVVDAVGDRVRITAGAGSNDTRHSIHLAEASAEAGAHGLLVVTPYYNKPPQSGLVKHFEAVADATDLPVLLYDIPGRSGIPIEEASLLELAEHPRILGVKDAKGDLTQASRVMRRTKLAWYSGDDAMNLAHLALGATGIIGVTSHVGSREYAAMIAACDAGDLAEAQRIHFALVPLVDAVMNQTQGAIMVKAALAQLGVLDHDTLRLPLVEATEEQRDVLRRGLVESGVEAAAEARA